MHVDSITTPFGRRMLTHAHLKHQANTALSNRTQAVDKWKVFRHISEARNKLGLQDRALAVLNALLSFFPAAELDPKQTLIVFPSNTQLALRAHGVCARTLRRCLAALVDAGIICRNDSPNGKRYAHRSRNGEIECAYGFDLRPLVTRATEFAELAEAILEETRNVKRTKEAISICRRDLRKLIQLHCQGTNNTEILAISVALDDTLAAIPRQPSKPQLDGLLSSLQSLRGELLNRLKLFEKSPVSSTNEGQDDRHKEESESESYIEQRNRKADATTRVSQNNKRDDSQTSTSLKQSEIPLDLILRACPDILACSPAGEIESWQSLIRATEMARDHLGVNKTQYLSCRQEIGEKSTAMLLSFLFQRQARIKSTGAYFCQLFKMAKADRLNTDRMLLSLLKQAYEKPPSAPQAESETIAISDRLNQLTKMRRSDGRHLPDKLMVRISRKD